NLARAVLGANRGGRSDRETGYPAAMNTRCEVRPLCVQGQSAGAQRLRRIATGKLLPVRESPAWWKLKWPLSTLGALRRDARNETGQVFAAVALRPRNRSG